MSSGRGFFAPIFAGIADHRERVAGALWEFVLLVNWTTGEVPDPSEPGEYLGVVLGGRPVAANEIAEVLRCSVDTVRRHLDRLESGGYIVREVAAGGAYRFTVKKSKKWMARNQGDAAIGKNAQGKTAEVATQNCLGDYAELPSGLGKTAEPYKERTNRTNKTNDKPSASACAKSVAPDLRHMPVRGEI